jgi:lipopolysaccharide assembly protein B
MAAPVLLVGLVMLLLGLAVGKAWERYKLQDGVWIDRRRARESPHYMLGLNFLVASQVDQAIDELTKAAKAAGDPLEIHLILGNLYREKGQVGRAIQEHQALLQRPKLRKLEHANVLLCLGLDYRSGGFVDRAIEAFNEVLKLDPDNRYALSNLEKLYEDQHQWDQAYTARQKLAALSSLAEGGPESPRHDEVLAFLENEFGQAALKSGDPREAARRFEAAIDRDPRNVPAHLSLGDVRFHDGKVADAVDVWEGLLDASPERGYLAFPRLENAYSTLGAPDRFPALCEKLIAANPQDWRARLALARHRAGQGSHQDALTLLFDALVVNPHSLALHQAIWETLSALHLPPPLVAKYVALTRDAVFYLDPHVCLRCRYRSTELLWQCPHCHEWNTFVEERIAPAKENADV